MRILSIIPARGGSKGIPNKNLIKLNKKPLLFYTVSASKNSKLVNRTVVSTDSKKIMNFAKKLGVEVVVRPKKLATDYAKVESVISHVLQRLEKNENYIPNTVVLLSNTSPLRTSQHLDKAFKLFLTKDFNSV